jgi:DNA-binding transcriptional MerR regulator
MSPESDLQMSVGKFSQITALSPRALRLYEEKGFLVPRRDRFNNYRYYTADQVEAGLKIKMLNWMGFSCAEINEILACLDDPGGHEARIEHLFKKRLAWTQIEIQKLRKVEEVLQGKST